MKITYPDGTVHSGKKDFIPWLKFLGITDLEFKNKTVLDIATDEGWWAFWSEMQGAKYVEASDVERGEDYDWGWHKNKKWIQELNQTRGGRSVFDFHHKNLNSNVAIKKQSIYDIEGEFDYIFCHGLLYHLRHPLLAIDNCRKCCKGFAIFETFVDIEQDQKVAQSKFYRTNEFGSISNWTGASTAGLTSWLKDAGFEDVYYSHICFPRQTRRFVVGVADPEYNKIFKTNSNLHYCDIQYWREVFTATRWGNTIKNGRPPECEF